MLSLDHPNILTLCGARASPPEYYLLFPYQENGSVSRLVHDQRWAPTWGAALILLQEIAAALAIVCDAAGLPPALLPPPGADTAAPPSAALIGGAAALAIGAALVAQQQGLLELPMPMP